METKVDKMKAARPRGPIVSVQEITGKALYVDERSFRGAGLDPSGIVGRSWKEFSPPNEHAYEINVIDKVVYTGDPANFHVIRQWPGRTVNILSKTSIITTKSGTKLLLREGRIIERNLAMPIDFLLDARGSIGSLDAIEVIEQFMDGAAGLAAREQWSLLRYLIGMAREAAREQRAEIMNAL